MPQGGAIINVGSARACKPSPTLLPLLRDQGIHRHLYEGLAPDVVRYGLRANCSRRAQCGPIIRPLWRARRSLSLAHNLRWDLPISPLNWLLPSSSWPLTTRAMLTVRS